MQQVETFDALGGANDTAIADENGAPIRLIPDEVGPNGGPVGLNKNGDQVEVLPDDEEDDGSWTLILLRSVRTIAAQYDEFREKVWWNRHQCWLDRLGTGEETLTPQCRPIFDEAQRQANRILAKHGVENLIMDDFELGFVNGQMAALAWVTGAEWDEAGDT